MDKAPITEEKDLPEQLRSNNEHDEHKSFFIREYQRNKDDEYYTQSQPQLSEEGVRGIFQRYYRWLIDKDIYGLTQLDAVEAILNLREPTGKKPDKIAGVEKIQVWEQQKTHATDNTGASNLKSQADDRRERVAKKMAYQNLRDPSMNTIEEVWDWVNRYDFEDEWYEKADEILSELEE